MKKLLYFVLLAVVFTACSKTQKAESLIKEDLKKSLYKPDTYKSVETKVDSAFAPYDNPKLLEELEVLIKMNSEYEKLESEIKYAKSSMSIWDDDYMSSYGINEYQEAKSNYNEANEKIEKLKEKWKKQYKKIESMLKEHRQFVGFKASHNYRADNNAGQTLIGNALFFIDKDFNEIIYSIDVERYNQLQEAIKQIEDEISENAN